MKYQYIKDFNKMAMGIFCHFGLYSVVGKGEWWYSTGEMPWEEYAGLSDKFYVKEDWAKELVSLAKSAGAKYITLTTRHHDGFSLFDTQGLNDFDAPHSACKRDLVREFVDACNAEGIVPFFYHTLLDWSMECYKTDFPKYIDYLIKSVEILCKNYGKIGGLWFDGMWDRPNDDWQEDRLYGTIRKYQPEAMIINNTGLVARGQTGHPEIDSVTFERGTPNIQRHDGKPIAGEMCQVLNDHWGYAENDLNYKSMNTFIYDLVDCRYSGCNYLLNVGPCGDGSVSPIDKTYFERLGKWVAVNKNFIYDARPSEYKGEDCQIVEDDEAYYVMIKNVPMSANANVALGGEVRSVGVDSRIQGSAYWLDNGKPAVFENGKLNTEPFSYGNSYVVRVAKIEKNK